MCPPGSFAGPPSQPTKLGRRLPGGMASGCSALVYVKYLTSALKDAGVLKFMDRPSSFAAFGNLVANLLSYI